MGSTSEQAVRSYERLCFSAVAYTIPRGLQAQVRRRQHGADLAQEIRLCAWQAERDQLNYRATVRLVGRICYRFLKNYGWRRPKGAQRYVRETLRLRRGGR